MSDDNPPDGRAGKPMKYMRYAIGEILLVVIGILIALSINNWNEDRKDRIKEKSILINIRENLIINDSLISDYVKYHLKNNHSSQIIIETITNTKPYSDTLDVHFNRARFQIVGSTYLSYMGYEELKNVGFDIIRNETLKNEILKLFEVTYSSKIQKLKWFDQIDPYREKNLYDNFKDSKGFLKPINYDSLLLDNYYISMITALKIQRSYWVEMLNECKLETQKLNNLINDELQE